MKPVRSVRVACLLVFAGLLYLPTLAVLRAQTPKAEANPSKTLSQFWNKSFAFRPGINEANPIVLPTTLAQLLAKAAPDECFNGIGNPYPPGPPCTTGVPKVNQAYVWGLTRTGTNLWFGTMSNTHCLVLSLFLGITSPLLTPSFVCEFGDSQLSPPLPAALGDFRTPRVFIYDTVAKTLIPKTPPDPLITTTAGLRAAGNLNNVVFLAGPSLSPAGGVNFFAFRADTGQYLGSNTQPAYNNIRRFLVADNALYITVGNTLGGGSVLRWTGSQATPFTFDVVGSLETSSWEIAAHDGRLFVTTFPSTPGPLLAGLFMSPILPPGGLTNADAGSWTRIWKADDYEPDPVTAATYGGGALASFGGYLYWGTMHVPILSTEAHIATYGIPTSDANVVLQTFLGSERAISIFRASGFNATPSIDLIYGLPVLPKFTPPSSWTLVPNNMNKLPQWGPSGFGNPFNNYTWTMEVFDGRLFVGTMDFSYLIGDLVNQLLGSPTPLPPAIAPLPTIFGADLFYFPSAQSPAYPESINGIGNYTSYGIRTMVTSASSLYVGMANPMNLLTNTSDNIPEGGWELLELTAHPSNTQIGQTVNVNLGNGIVANFCNVTRAGTTLGVGVPNNLPTGFNADLVPLPTGYLAPSTYYGIASSADWRNSTCGGRLGSVCVSAPNPYAHLFQLQFNAATGSFEWKDITESNTGVRLCGGINQNFLGALAVMQPVLAVPTLSEYGLWFLCGALLLAGLILLKKKNKQGRPRFDLSV